MRCKHPHNLEIRARKNSVITSIKLKWHQKKFCHSRKVWCPILRHCLLSNGNSKFTITVCSSSIIIKDVYYWSSHNKIFITVSSCIMYFPTIKKEYTFSMLIKSAMSVIWQCVYTCNLLYTKYKQIYLAQKHRQSNRNILYGSDKYQSNSWESKRNDFVNDFECTES